MTRIIILLLATTFMAGCPATTAVNSDPLGAKVFVDGEYVGNTPIAIRLSDWYSESKIRCEKEGFTPQERLVIKQGHGTYQTQSGMATAYNPNTGQTAYGTGFGTTSSYTSSWPPDVFFKLEKIKEEKKEEKK